MNKEDSDRLLEQSQSLQLYVLLSNISFGLAGLSFVSSLVLIFLENAFAFLLMPLAMIFCIVGLVFMSCESSQLMSIKQEFIIPYNNKIKAKNKSSKKNYLKKHVTY